MSEAEFDYEPEEDVKDEALPLVEGQKYWIFEYDAEGWSIVSSVNYPQVKSIAPSNYLKLIENANTQYRWSKGVLKECGGDGVLKENTNEQDAKDNAQRLQP